MASDNKKEEKRQFPIKQEDMVEGVHYYLEDSCLVFTTLYHELRGYCCKNNCRHCAYVPKNNDNDQNNDD